MTVIQILEKVKDTLKEPSKWVKGHQSTTQDGKPVRLQKGTCFCIIGALWRHTDIINEHGTYGHQAEVLLNKLAKERGFENIVRFNDHQSTRHEDVIALLDEAIAKSATNHSC